MRFCLPSRSKAPPQKLEPLFQVNELFFGLFQHARRPVKAAEKDSYFLSSPLLTVQDAAYYNHIHGLAQSTE
jgi:hypothetical protein